MIKVSVKALESVAKDRPAGYLDEVSAKGKRTGDVIEFEPSDYLALRAKYSPGPTLSMGDKLKHAAGAAGRITSAVIRGKKTLISDAEQERRMSICAACEFFTGTTCKKCGCHIRFKAKLQTEHCPIGKW